MGSLKVELNPKHEILDLRNESRSPNCGHILSSSPIYGHCLDDSRRALCLEQEWSSLTRADGQEKWGKETGERGTECIYSSKWTNQLWKNWALEGKSQVFLLEPGW